MLFNIIPVGEENVVRRINVNSLSEVINSFFVFLFRKSLVTFSL